MKTKQFHLNSIFDRVFRRNFCFSYFLILKKKFELTNIERYSLVFFFYPTIINKTLFRLWRYDYKQQLSRWKFTDIICFKKHEWSTGIYFDLKLFPFSFVVFVKASSLVPQSVKAICFPHLHSYPRLICSCPFDSEFTWVCFTNILGWDVVLNFFATSDEKTYDSIFAECWFFFWRFICLCGCIFVWLPAKTLFLLQKLIL